MKYNMSSEAPLSNGISGLGSRQMQKKLLVDLWRRIFHQLESCLGDVFFFCS